MNVICLMNVTNPILGPGPMIIFSTRVSAPSTISGKCNLSNECYKSYLGVRAQDVICN